MKMDIVVFGILREFRVFLRNGNGREWRVMREESLVVEGKWSGVRVQV